MIGSARVRSEDELGSEGDPIWPVRKSGTMTTTTAPCRTSSGQKSEGSSSVWVHLHSTICTEWSKEWMVIKQAGHQEGLVKAPKTIHRCILKTSVSTRSQGRPRLSCHVCYASYQDYKTYFRHLINNSCVKQPTVDKSLLKSSLTIYAPSSAAEAATLSLINSTSLLAEDSSGLKFKNILKRANSPTVSVHRKAGPGPPSPPALTDRGGTEEEVQIIAEKRVKIHDQDTEGTAPPVNPSAKEREKDHFARQDSPAETTPESSEVNVSASEREASETLLLLSSNSQHRSPHTPTPASLGVDVGEKSQDDEVTSSSNIQEEIKACCPCEASLSMEAISEEEAETDREDLRVFSHKLSLLLRLLLGEKKMIQLGAPDVSSPDLLEKVLRLTGSKVVREDDLCSERCKTETNSRFADESQVGYRIVKSRRAALELNTEAFMKICIPHNEVWNKLGWRGKGVSQIISQIVDNGVPTSTIPKKNNLCKKF